MGLFDWIYGLGAVGMLSGLYSYKKKTDEEIQRKEAERQEKEAEERRLRQIELEEQEREKRRYEEEYWKRRRMVCRFDDGMTESEFRNIVNEACKDVKRISSISFQGPFVYVVIRSQSGISDWRFELDFNDYGHVTGRCSWRSENSESTIPQSISKRIKRMIIDFYRTKGITFE